MTERNELTSAIRTSLSSLSRSGTVSVLPDYFVDRFVKIKSIDELIISIKKKTLEAGGGSLRGIPQFEVKGGNAVNVAYSLGKFGARVNLFAIADSLNEETLRSTFRPYSNVHLKILLGKNGYTIAIEFLERGKPVNLMLSDTGDLAEFDGSSISDDTLDLISFAKIVSVVNWAANNRGNDLCSKVFSSAKDRGAFTFFDPADAAQLSHNIPELKKKIFDRGLVDYISLNENELRIFSKVLSNSTLPQDYTESDLKKGIKLMSEASGARVDVHSRHVSLTCKSNDCILVPCYKVDQKVITGAGDVWDGADIVGYLLGWEAEWRLRFANAAAGLYVSQEEPESPGLEQVLDMIGTQD